MDLTRSFLRLVRRLARNPGLYRLWSAISPWRASILIIRMRRTLSLRCSIRLSVTVLLLLSSLCFFNNEFWDVSASACSRMDRIGDCTIGRVDQ
jgi:hypothetical protein